MQLQIKQYGAILKIAELYHSKYLNELKPDE